MKKNPKLKLESGIINRQVDYSTGEILEENLINAFHRLTNNKDSFMLIYSKLLSILTDYDGTLADIKVYSHLLSNSNTTKPFSVNKTIKEIICESTGLSLISVDKALSSLTQNRNGYSPLLLKVGRGTYQINPMYAFKGSSTDRNATLKIVLTNNPELFKEDNTLPESTNVLNLVSNKFE